MRIIQYLLLIGILVSLTAATASPKDDKSKKVTERGDTPNGTAREYESSAATERTTSTLQGRSAKSMKSNTAGDNRGKRNLYDFGNNYLYSQVAARRAGYSPDPRTAYNTQQALFNGNGIGQYPGNYGPYPQYIEAPEPIIEIIIKDANETLPSAQPTVVKTKKKKEKVHVFYVNYKKDENNKLHLESPIASLNNDETEEEEEEEVIEYPVTPSPPVKSTTLRAIIHPDSEKYHADSGIHVTFGAETKAHTGHDEHDAESVQRQVVAVPVPSAHASLKTQYIGNARQDFQGQARSPFSSSLFQTSPTLQYQGQAQQQLPNQHVTSLFRSVQQQHQQTSQYSQQPNYPSKTQSQVKSPFSAQRPPQGQYNQQHQQKGQPQQQQQNFRKPLNQIQQQINQQLQQQSQYYVNHNQLYQTQQQPQQNTQSNQYYNNLPQKPTPAPKQPIVFPTAPSKSQELPIRQTPQPYQPIKFRPTPASISAQNKPTPIAVKLENSHYNSKPYQFQRQPQFIQQPTFTVQSPTISPPQYYKQQQQSFNHAQSSNYQSGNSNYYTQNKNQQPSTSSQQQPQHSRPQTHSSSGGSSPNLSWLNIKPSKETELFKSIPKFEQHITETIQNNYQPSSYQTQNQVIHDIPAPNLGPQQQQQYVNTNSYNNQYQPQSPPQSQTPVQSQFTNFVTSSSNSLNQHQAITTPSPQFVESTNGQKIMVVTPMPPNVYQQYQAAHYPSPQDNQAQIITSIHQSQDQYNDYFQQPRQGSGSTQSESIKDGANSANSQFSVSTYHSDVFKELEQRKPNESHQSESAYIPSNEANKQKTEPTSTTTTPNPKVLQQLPDEVPDDLRQQLISSGILSNADISILDYDKEGDIALENLPAEHLQHFYGAGGGAQISESKKVLSVLKPNGDKVSLDAKEIERVKESSTLPHNKQVDAKIVRFEGTESETVEASGSAERQYNRYLPLKINAANFPKPDVEDLKSKTLHSVVVLAPVDGSLVEDTKEVKFLGGDLIKTLVKKPTKENFKRWLEKESRTDVEQQSVVLLVAEPSSTSTEQEIFMYDISTGEVNRLNGELSSKFVNVAEENASAEDLERGSTLDPNFLDAMMQRTTS